MALLDLQLENPTVVFCFSLMEIQGGSAHQQIGNVGFRDKTFSRKQQMNLHL